MKRYVALEGGDGSGKSTIAAALSARLEALGNDVIVVREPGGTAVGEAIRGLLLDSEKLDEWTEVFLFAAQRAELAREVIGPALEAGAWVISDRTYYSSIAYQGRGRGLGEERVRHINEVGLDGVVPDWVFVLDVDPVSALARQHDPDRIGKQGVEFQEAVRDSYIALSATDKKVAIVDGNRTVEEIVNLIVEAVL